VSAPPTCVPCRKCGQPIEATDAFCRFCGTQQRVTDPLYYHPIVILLLAFLVLGPFALGLVWRAQAMDRNTKIALYAIITAYSAVTIYAAYKIIMIAYRELSVLSDIL